MISLKQTRNLQLISQHWLNIASKEAARLKFAYLPVADLALASEGLPDVEGLPSDVLFPTEVLGPRDDFLSRTTCLLWFPMFKVPSVVRLILEKK